MRAITTERLVLEPVTSRNAPALWRVMQSAHLRDYQDVPRLSRDEFVRRVASRPPRFDGRAIGRFEWLVVVRRSKTAIGWVSLRIGDHPQEAAELGYSVVAPARKKGYATEAVRAVVGLAFTDGGMVRIDACCVPENLPSRKLLERLGFSQTKLQPNGAVVKGRPVDVCVYVVTRTDWDGAENGTG